MPAASENVPLPGKTGSDQPKVRTTRLAHNGHPTLFWSGQQRTIEILTWRDTMNKAFVAIGLGLALSGVAFAQQKSAKEEIAGAWTLVSVTSEMDDGNKGEPFGSSPNGVIIFANDGHFSLFQSRADIPKIAANDRAKA